MKNTTPRIWPWFTAVSISAAIFLSVTHWLVASPSELIAEAVAENRTNAQQASPDQFIQAFSAVLTAVDQKESTAYVDAAVKLRPDLKDRIAVAAKDVGSSPAGDTSLNNASGHKELCCVCCDQLTAQMPCSLTLQYLKLHPKCVFGKCHPHA